MLRNGTLDQDNCSQLTALSLVVLMGDAVSRGEQSQQAPLLYTAAVLGLLENRTTLQSLLMSVNV